MYQCAPGSKHSLDDAALLQQRPQAAVQLGAVLDGPLHIVQGALAPRERLQRGLHNGVHVIQQAPPLCYYRRRRGCWRRYACHGGRLWLLVRWSWRGSSRGWLCLAGRCRHQLLAPLLDAAAAAASHGAGALALLLVSLILHKQLRLPQQWVPLQDWLSGVIIGGCIACRSCSC
jgi:hypothetical protein